MIEAATASVMTSQVARTVVEQSSSAPAIAASASPVRQQKAAVNNAPYLSPYVVLSPGVKPITVLRDADTGAQISQYPTPAQIRAYQMAQAQASVTRAPTTTVSGGEVATPDAKQVSYEQAKFALESSVQYQEIKKEMTRAAPAPVQAPAPQPQQPAAPLPGANVGTGTRVSTVA